MKKRSALRIVYSELDVKLWAKSPPSVAAVRPQKCPCCGQAGAVAGKPLGLVGHGKRDRLVFGPFGPDGDAEQLIIALRRYRCRGCGAIVMSAPRGILRRMLYGAIAVGFALVLWAAEGMAGWRVRERVTGTRSDYVRLHGWRSLGRWARTAQHWWSWLQIGAGNARARALSVVTQLAARATTATGPLVVLACEGALT